MVFQPGKSARNVVADFVVGCKCVMTFLPSLVAGFLGVRTLTTILRFSFRIFLIIFNYYTHFI